MSCKVVYIFQWRDSTGLGPQAKAFQWGFPQCQLCGCPTSVGNSEGNIKGIWTNKNMTLLVCWLNHPRPLPKWQKRIFYCGFLHAWMILEFDNQMDMTWAYLSTHAVPKDWTACLAQKSFWSLIHIILSHSFLVFSKKHLELNPEKCTKHVWSGAGYVLTHHWCDGGSSFLFLGATQIWKHPQCASIKRATTRGGFGSRLSLRLWIGIGFVECLRGHHTNRFINQSIMSRKCGSQLAP